MKENNYRHHGLLAKPPTILLCVALLSGVMFGVNGFDKNDREINELLERTLSSLEKMVAFFGQDYSSVNVDGLFGVRVGQGSVNQTETDCSDSRFRCPRGLVQRLMGLNDEIEKIANNAMPYVEAEDQEYFDRFHPTLDGPYILHYKTEVIGDHDSDIHGNRKYDEEKGDRCLSLLMGTLDKRPKCSMSDECWDFMSQEHNLGYVLTHQLLYFIIADKNGCVPAIEARLRSKGVSSLREYETKLCGLILAEAKYEDNKGKVNILKQDLFLEQSLLCGALGYQNFMTPEWVKMVLSWQSSHGCFTMMLSLHQVDSQIDKLRGEERRLLRLMQQEAKDIDQATPVTGRKLLREKLMPGNCLSHKTGLAFGLVGAYIRHFVRQLYAPPELTTH